MAIKFKVYGNPKALKRHRDRKPVKGKRGNYFTPKFDPSAPDKADFLAKCMQHRPESPLNCPLSIYVDAYFPRPKNHFGSNKGEAYVLDRFNCVWHTKKPDGDNLLKFVKDTLNGIFWTDDSIIAISNVRKMYCDMGETPRVVIEIEQLI